MAILSIKPITNQMVVTVQADILHNIAIAPNNGEIVEAMVKELYCAEVHGTYPEGNFVNVKYADNANYPSKFLVDRSLYPQVVVSWVG